VHTSSGNSPTITDALEILKYLAGMDSVYNNAVTTPSFEKIKFGGHDWIVLEKSDGKALILSEYLFERRNFITGSTITEYRPNVDVWAVSGIRAYLNGEFYESFSAADRERIVETLVVNNPTTAKNSVNEIATADAGPDTTDKIFLLSIEEAQQYFGSATERIARFENSSGEWGEHWMLRSPTGSIHFVAEVQPGGHIWVDGGIGGSNRSVLFAIRPAMWITL
jgi:hypothetical protein